MNTLLYYCSIYGSRHLPNTRSELQSSNFPTVSIYLTQYITMNMEYSYKYQNIVYYLLPMVSPGTLSDPSEGSKKTSRTDEAESSKIEAKDGGSNELPFVM